MAGDRGTAIGRVAVAAAAAILLTLAGAADAQQTPPKKAEPPLPSPEKGLAFAQRFCSNCHLVEASGNATAEAGIPSLAAIANKAGQSGNHIRNILINPHPPMPDMQVSNQEILDLVAYLETLRKDKSQPPLIAPVPGGQKPAYPKPS